MFAFLFGQLGIGGTADAIRRIAPGPEIHHPLPAGGVKAAKSEDVGGLAD
jgi:hypothetical protein